MDLDMDGGALIGALRLFIEKNTFFIEKIRFFIGKNTFFIGKISFYSLRKTVFVHWEEHFLY